MTRRDPQESKPGLRAYSPFGGKMRFGHSGEVGGLRAADVILWVVNFAALVATIVVASEYGWTAALILLASVIVVEAVVIAAVRRRR